MEKNGEFKGINGNLLAFKEEVADAEKVTFAGVPGACTPFAELFAYVIRDKESVFIPLTDIDSARKIELTPQGMQLSESADPKADVVALLGGLTMPKASIEIDDVNEMVAKILKKDGKLIGLSYMNMFKEAGWIGKVDFDCIIDGTLTGTITKK
ncbi:DUF2124 family protein [Methanobacterium sp. ACI-7]|uniref:DUF2124 family protein n=1 Tax=unclassified Methanobacterium TaxID=2627676 RepID=UPI0039C21576